MKIKEENTTAKTNGPSLSSVNIRDLRAAQNLTTLFIDITEMVT